MKKLVLVVGIFLLCLDMAISEGIGDSIEKDCYVWNRNGIRSEIYATTEKEETYSYWFNGCRFGVIEMNADLGLCHGEIEGLMFWIPIENMSTEIPDEPYYLTRTCVKSADILDIEREGSIIATIPVDGVIKYYGHLNQYSLVSYDGIMGFIDYRPPYLLGAFNPWQTENYIPKGLFDPELATQMAKEKLISENFVTKTELENMKWKLLYDTYLIHSFIYRVRFYPEYPRLENMYYVDIDAETGHITNFGYDEYPLGSS